MCASMHLCLSQHAHSLTGALTACNFPPLPYLCCAWIACALFAVLTVVANRALHLLCPIDGEVSRCARLALLQQQRHNHGIKAGRGSADVSACWCVRVYEGVCVSVSVSVCLCPSLCLSSCLALWSCFLHWRTVLLDAPDTAQIRLDTLWCHKADTLKNRRWNTQRHVKKRQCCISCKHTHTYTHIHKHTALAPT